MILSLLLFVCFLAPSACADGTDDGDMNLFASFCAEFPEVKLPYSTAVDGGDEHLQLSRPVSVEHLRQYAPSLQDRHEVYYFGRLSLQNGIGLIFATIQQESGGLLLHLHTFSPEGRRVGELDLTGDWDSGEQSSQTHALIDQDLSVKITTRTVAYHSEGDVQVNVDEAVSSTTYLIGSDGTIEGAAVAEAEHPVQDRDPGGCGWSDTDTRRGSGVAPFLSREGLVQALHPEEFAPEEKICGLGVRQWKHLDDTFAVILEVQHDREEEPFRRVWVGLFRAQEYSGVRELIARTRIHLRDDGEFSHFDLTPIRIAEDQYAFGLGSITRIPLAGGGGSFTTLDLFTLEQGDLRRVLSTVVESNMLMAGAWREDGSREHTEIEAAAVLSITANKRAGHYDLVKTLTFERTWELDEDGERILSDSSATPKRAVFGWTGSAYQSNDADPLADPLREMEIAEGLPVIAAQIEPYFSLHNEEGEMPWYEGYQRIGHPRASSALSPPGGPGYPIENICDYDPLTAWVEGDAGQGIGSRFAFTIWEDPVILENENEDPFSGRCFVANGYYKSQTIWSQNSRVRRLRVTLNGRNLCLIDLQDYRGIQSFTLRDFMRIKQDGEDKSHLPLIVNGDELAFEILSVYPGTKFEDTAISEFITDEILYSY